MTETEERVALLIDKSLAEWDSIHGDGWNMAYIKTVPTASHHVARAICAEFGLAAAEEA